MNGLSFIRRRCNLSQGQLAEKLGVTRYITELAENFQDWLRKRNAQINSALAKSDSARYNDSRRER